MYGQTTRRAPLLAQMGRVMLWTELCAAIESFNPKASPDGGCCRWSGVRGVYLLQQSFDLSDRDGRLEVEGRRPLHGTHRAGKRNWSRAERPPSGLPTSRFDNVTTKSALSGTVIAGQWFRRTRHTSQSPAYRWLRSVIVLPVSEADIALPNWSYSNARGGARKASQVCNIMIVVLVDVSFVRSLLRANLPRPTFPGMYALLNQRVPLSCEP